MILESDVFVEEAERYSRQIILPEIHIEGHNKLRNAKILVVGCGGLGSPVIMYLSSCGIGTIGLVDFDRVEAHNLQRQIIYSESDINEYKVVAAGKFVEKMCSFVNVEVHNKPLNEENIKDILHSYEIIVDCTDSIKTRYLLNDHCRNVGKSLICGSSLRWDGQIYKIVPDGPCYRCLFPKRKSFAVSCEDGGIVGPVCGVIGSLLALETIKLIIGDLEPRMIVYSGRTNTFTSAKLRGKKACCAACSTRASIQPDIQETKCLEIESSVVQRDDIPSLDWEVVLKNRDSYSFVDVRSQIQFKILRVCKSINIPLCDLPSELETIRSMRKKVAVVCRRGISSLEGAKILKDNGINAYSINGGINKLKVYIKENPELN